AEDGIRDRTVTGVQTCALPIWQVAEEVPIDRVLEVPLFLLGGRRVGVLVEDHPQGSELAIDVVRGSVVPRVGRVGDDDRADQAEIGRASCREGGEMGGGVARLE